MLVLYGYFCFIFLRNQFVKVFEIFFLCAKYILFIFFIQIFSVINIDLTGSYYVIATLVIIIIIIIIIANGFKQLWKTFYNVLKGNIYLFIYVNVSYA